jgi:hypothetical protein
MINDGGDRAGRAKDEGWMCMTRYGSGQSG